MDIKHGINMERDLLMRYHKMILNYSVNYYIYYINIAMSFTYDVKFTFMFKKYYLFFNPLESIYFL